TSAADPPPGAGRDPVPWAVSCLADGTPSPRCVPGRRHGNDEMDMKFFASCAKGLEYLLADELLALGCARATATTAGVNVEGSLQDAQRAVLWSRLASRVLWPLAEYACADEHALYAGAREVSWHEHLDATMTLAVDAHVSGSAITHARYAAQRVKDAVVDALREQGGARPDVDVVSPDIRLNLVVRMGGDEVERSEE